MLNVLSRWIKTIKFQELTSKDFSRTNEDDTSDSRKWTSVREVLEDSATVKVFCDPRSDSDALYHHYGILLQNVFCVQLAEVKLRRNAGHKVQYVKSRKQIILEYGGLSEEELREWNSLERGKSQGIASINFSRRPLSNQSLEYSAVGVAYLLRIYMKMVKRLFMDENWIKEESKVKVEKCLLPSYEEEENGAKAPSDWAVLYMEGDGGVIHSVRFRPQYHYWNRNCSKRRVGRKN